MGISVLGASDPGTFLVLPQTLLLRGYEHVHEYQIINENKIGWYLKVKYLGRNMNMVEIRVRVKLETCKIGWKHHNDPDVSKLIIKFPSRKRYFLVNIDVSN